MSRLANNALLGGAVRVNLGLGLETKERTKGTTKPGNPGHLSNYSIMYLTV